MTVTGTPLTLRLYVHDIAGILTLYNEMQVFRSESSALGPWSAAASSAAVASILGDETTEPFKLNGTTLELKVNLVNLVSCAFVGADPYNLAATIVNVNAALGILGSASGAGGSLRISTALTGTAASIEINGGDAFPFLGFQASDSGVGVDAGILLVAGVQEYIYTDNNGSSNYWYRTRYHNSATGQASEYSAAFPAVPVRKLPIASLITGYCDLVGLMGEASVGKRVHIYNPYQLLVSGGYVIVGRSEVSVADKDGHVEFTLVRSSKVDVSIEGTPIRRRIEVPTIGASFDLFDPTLAEDEFGIQEPVINYAERTFP